MSKVFFTPALLPVMLLTVFFTNTAPATNISSIPASLPAAALAARIDPGKSAPKTKNYHICQPNTTGLSKTAFRCAMKGLRFLERAHLVAKKNIVTIIDFSKPSTQKRLFVVEVVSGKVLFNTWVAHGQNSGNEYASRFSNLPDSHQSSLGFYITLDTYFGGNGYSLRLKGCERGINDNAYERSIVVHGAAYVSDQFINARGAPGRSYGCPAIPAALSRDIIDLIKNGSCLFIYHPTRKYCLRSKILNSHV